MFNFYGEAFNKKSLSICEKFGPEGFWLKKKKGKKTK